MNVVFIQTTIAVIIGSAGVCAIQRTFPPLDKGTYEEESLRKKVRETYDHIANNYIWIQMWGLIIVGAAAAHKKINLETYISCVSILGVLGKIFDPYSSDRGCRKKTESIDAGGPLRPTLVYIPHMDSVGTVYLPEGSDGTVQLPQDLINANVSFATREQLEQARTKKQLGH